MSIYDLTEENRALRERARSFAEEISPYLARWEETEEFPYGVVRRMGEEGFYGAHFPEEYGGCELGFRRVRGTGKTRGCQRAWEIGTPTAWERARLGR